MCVPTVIICRYMSVIHRKDIMHKLQLCTLVRSSMVYHRGVGLKFNGNDWQLMMEFLSDTFTTIQCLVRGNSATGMQGIQASTVTY